LQRLLDDAEARLSHVKEKYAVGPDVENLISIRNDTRDRNREQVDKTLSLECELLDAHHRVADLQKTLSEKVATYKAKLAQIERKCTISKQALLAGLEAKRRDLDAQSEALGGKYRKEQQELSDFLRDYQELRTKYHALGLKLEATA